MWLLAFGKHSEYVHNALDWESNADDLIDADIWDWNEEERFSL